MHHSQKQQLSANMVDLDKLSGVQHSHTHTHAARNKTNGNSYRETSLE